MLPLLVKLHSFICCMWLEGCSWPWQTCSMSHFTSVVLVVPVCACLATLQQGNSGNLLWLIAHIAANVAESFVQTVPPIYPSTSALFRPKRSMWMILTVVNTRAVFPICKEHPQGHTHAQPCCHSQGGPSPAAEKQWRWQGHERDHTTPQITQQTSLTKWYGCNLWDKAVFFWG